VSLQSEQPAVNTSIFRFRGIAVPLRYMPLQQHLSSVFPVSLHRSFPFFCGWQQHVFTSLPVNVQVNLDAEKALDAISAANVTVSKVFMPVA